MEDLWVAAPSSVLLISSIVRVQAPVRVPNGFLAGFSDSGCPGQPGSSSVHTL